MLLTTQITVPDNPLMRFAQDIACVINWHGYECFVVGGAVRDWMMQDLGSDAEPNDIDMMTPMPVGLLKRLQLAECTIVPTGEQYGTLTFVRDGMKIEVTTCREDFGNQDAGDNRRDVNPTFVTVNGRGPKIDVARRDLTINGLFMCPFTGAVWDYNGGVWDLFNKRIRFIGNAVERSREDALRLLRAIMFAARFGFTIDPGIFEASEDPIVQARLAVLSAERVRDTFVKTITVQDGNLAAWSMTMYLELGLLHMWFPEMVPMVDCEQNIFHSHDVWGHTLLAVEYSQPELIHRLFALWHDLGKPECAEFKHEDYGYSFHNHPVVSARIMRQIAERLKFGHREPVHLDLLEHLIEHHMDAFISGKMSRVAKRLGFDKFADEYGAQYILDLTWEVGRSDFFGRAPGLKTKRDEIRGADEKLRLLYEKVREYIAEMVNPVFSPRDLAINGHDVMRITEIPPGPEVGRIIRELFHLVQDGTYPNERYTLMHVLSFINRVKDCGIEWREDEV